MANYLWGVTATEVLRRAGHPAPTSPTLPTATACGEFVDSAAAWVNGETAALTDGDPETLALANDVTYQLGRAIVIKIAQAEWLKHNGGDPTRANELLDESIGRDRDGRSGMMSTLRRLMAQAREALKVAAGPEEARTTSTGTPTNQSKVITDGWFT